MEYKTYKLINLADFICVVSIKKTPLMVVREKVKLVYSLQVL